MSKYSNEPKIRTWKMTDLRAGEDTQNSESLVRIPGKERKMVPRDKCGWVSKLSIELVFNQFMQKLEGGQMQTTTK